MHFKSLAFATLRLNYFTRCALKELKSHNVAGSLHGPIGLS